MARERPPWVGLDDERSATSDAPRVATESWHGDSVNDHLRRELAARGGESTTLRVSSVAAASVDAYIEYRRIVGDADGGQLFSDEEYARYRAAATAERSRNRLYVAWRNAAGLDCKARRQLAAAVRSARVAARALTARGARRGSAPRRFASAGTGIKSTPRTR